MKSTNNHLDEQIRRHLAGLEVGYDPSTWDRLAHRMDFEAQESVDDIFKSRLGGMEAPMTAAGSWEAFEQLIETDEAMEQVETDTPLDNTAYEKLNNLRVPYQEEHWALMAKRLEEEFSIRYFLYRYKVAEITLMGLLLLTVIRFTPFFENWNKANQAAQSVPLTSNQPIQLPGGTVNEQAIANITPVETQALYDSPIANADKSGDVPVPINGLSVLSITNEKNIGEPVLQSEVAAMSFRRVFNLKILPETDLATFENGSGMKAIIAAFDSKQQKLMAIDRKKKATPNAIAELSISPIDAKFAWELPNVKISQGKKQGDLRFGIFTTTDLNYVVTPPNQVLLAGKQRALEHNETMASGYGGGVTISWKKGRWEYQTGGIYSFKRYIPNTPVVIFNTLNFYVKEDFNGIQLDLLQVPLNVHYHFKNVGKWRMYATLGASTNFVTSTVYEIEREERALSLPIPPTEKTTSDLKSISDDLELTSGLADGGHLRDNFYMSANVGLGIERYLSPKWTVFFQPNYQHFILSKGIGANMDKIYTTSFYLGTKFNLK